MDGLQEKNLRNPTQKTQKMFHASQMVLRILAILSTSASCWIMVTSKQTADVFGIQMDAKYSYASAFKFCAFANAVVCAFSVISLVTTFFLSRPKSDSTNYFLLFMHDLIMMSLVLAGTSAGTAIGYVGKYGSSHAGWLAICHSFDKFCDRVTLSLVFSYTAFLLYLILTVITANKSRQFN
ncbi:Casparian strip membrane protein domain, partial [Dillenia turbinata]